ncbi:hypothetical protein [Aquifex sp.]
MNETLKRIEKAVFDQCVVLKGKVGTWKQVLKKSKNNKGRYQFRKLFQRLVGSIRILDKPYTYVIFLNGKPIYVGETKGGQENRGLAIWAIIVNAKHSHSPLGTCFEKIELNDDEVGILIIALKDKGFVKILERVLIEGFSLRPDCNKE